MVQHVMTQLSKNLPKTAKNHSIEKQKNVT